MFMYFFNLCICSIHIMCARALNEKSTTKKENGTSVTCPGAAVGGQQRMYSNSFATFVMGYGEPLHIVYSYTMQNTM